MRSDSIRFMEFLTKPDAKKHSHVYVKAFSSCKNVQFRIFEHLFLFSLTLADTDILCDIEIAASPQSNIIRLSFTNKPSVNKSAPMSMN